MLSIGTVFVPGHRDDGVRHRGRPARTSEAWSTPPSASPRGSAPSASPAGPRTGRRRPLDRLRRRPGPRAGAAVAGCDPPGSCRCCSCSSGPPSALCWSRSSPRVTAARRRPAGWLVMTLLSAGVTLGTSIGNWASGSLAETGGHAASLWVTFAAGCAVLVSGVLYATREALGRPRELATGHRGRKIGTVSEHPLLPHIRAALHQVEGPGDPPPHHRRSAWSTTSRSPTTVTSRCACC